MYLTCLFSLLHFSKKTWQFLALSRKSYSVKDSPSGSYSHTCFSEGMFALWSQAGITQVDEGRGQNVTFDPLYFENFLELEHHRCLITQPCAVNTQAKKKSLTADSSPVESVGKVFTG